MILGIQETNDREVCKFELRADMSESQFGPLCFKVSRNITSIGQSELVYMSEYVQPIACSFAWNVAVIPI